MRGCARCRAIQRLVEDALAEVLEGVFEGDTVVIDADGDDVVLRLA